MKITMSRKIQTAPYESADFAIEVDGDDLQELTLRAYKSVVKFEIFHGKVSREEGVANFRRYAETLGISDERLAEMMKKWKGSK